MSVKEEYDSADNTETFEETFINYITSSGTEYLWFLHQYIPKISEIRGRIVLFRRFNSERAIGINVSDWLDNQTFTKTNSDGVTYSVQDQYEVDSVGNNKYNQIISQITNAEDGSSNTFFFLILQVVLMQMTFLDGQKILLKILIQEFNIIYQIILPENE